MFFFAFFVGGFALAGVCSAIFVGIPALLDLVRRARRR
jgi:hypothetical protein